MQLQPVTTASLRGNHLVLDFAWGDAPGLILIGTVPAGVYVERVLVMVLTAFDQTVRCEVGRLLAPAELMVGTDSNASVVDDYHVYPDLVYAADTDAYLTLLVPGAAPTVGTGRVIIYLN